MNPQGPALSDEVSASSGSSVELGGAKTAGRSQMLSSDEVHTHSHTHTGYFISLLLMAADPISQMIVISSHLADFLCVLGFKA